MHFMSQLILIPFLLALSGNVLADLFLSLTLPEPLPPHPSRRWLRGLRWVSCTAALIGLVLLHASLPTLVVFTLFSITAATDLESTYLPPDAFMLGSTTLGLGLAFIQSGWPGLLDAVVAEAMCFAVLVFVVAFTGVCDSGDIKLGMQFGVAAGSLSQVFVGVMGMWLAMVIVLVMYLAYSRSPKAIRTRRIPQGPLAWIGLLLAVIWRVR